MCARRCCRRTRACLETAYSAHLLKVALSSEQSDDTVHYDSESDASESTDAGPSESAMVAGAPAQLGFGATRVSGDWRRRLPAGFEWSRGRPARAALLAPWD